MVKQPNSVAISAMGLLIFSGLRYLIERGAEDKIFGADVHRFRLNPRLSEEEVAQFERRHRIRLPDDYRAFLTLIGNGGAGPSYGVFRLGEMDGTGSDEPWTENNGFIGQIDKPFPHRKPWNPMSGFPSEDLPEGERERALDAFDKKYWRTDRVNGALPIGHHGCGLRDWLVVTGHEAGHVWRDERVNYKGLRPAQTSRRKRLTFLHWYMAWLRESLALVGSTGEQDSDDLGAPDSVRLY